MNRSHGPKPSTYFGQHSRAAGHHLVSYSVGMLPIVNRILERLRLDQTFRDDLPRADRRCRIDPAPGLLILPKNLLLCRVPLYGIGEWTARHAPDLLGLSQN